jgi:hypothetical protein
MAKQQQQQKQQQQVCAGNDCSREKTHRSKRRKEFISYRPLLFVVCLADVLVCCL